jgi:epsilon-lactone hydrolase
MSSLQNKFNKLILRFLVPLWRSDLPIAQQRKNLDKIAQMSKLIPGVQTETVDISGLRAEWISTRAVDTSGAILYFHGGGYVTGSVNTHRDLIARISQAARLRALGLDYRLAPENPFPAAVEDAVTAYRWLLAMGNQPQKIIIAGDSAGGGLTMATILKLREMGLPLPAGGVLLSPWVDLAGTGKSMQTKFEADITLKLFDPPEKARLYAGEYDLKHPLISPLFADLAGLPPLLIQVGTEEILLDDARRLAHLAQQAGVEVDLEVWDDMLHVFQAQAIFLPEARQAIQKIGQFIYKCVSTQ